MQSHIQRHHISKIGDPPVDIHTEQSIHSTMQRLITDESQLNTIAQFTDTAQSYQSFQPKLLQMVSLKSEVGIREEINYIEPSDITKYSEKLFNNLFCQESDRHYFPPKNDSQIALSQQNINKLLKFKRASISTEQLSSRLNAEYESIQIKKEQNEQVKYEEEIKGCTFKPVLGVKTQKIAQQLQKKDINCPPRYMSPKNKTSRYSKPLIPPIVKTKKIDTVQNKENVFQRLNKPQPKTKIIISRYNKEDQFSYLSVVKNQTRPQSPEPASFSQRLYEDAFKPKKTKVYLQDPEPPRTNKKKQERLQMDHFIKEFFLAIKRAREWTIMNWEEQKEKIDFQFDVENDLCLNSIDEMVFVLNQLGFLPLTSYNIQDPDNKAIQIFKLLLCPQEFGLILSRNLLIFLLAVQGLSISNVLVPSYTNSYEINFPKQFRNELFLFNDGNIQIENSQLIQKRFQGYYLSHLSYYHKVQPYEKESQDISEEARYHSEKTDKLATTFRDRIKSFVQNKDKIELNDFQQIYIKKKEIVSQEWKEKEIQGCSFKPMINKSTNKNYNTLLQRPQNQFNDAKCILQISFERQQDQCTFTPDISRSQSSHQTSNIVLKKNIDCYDSKDIERIVKGRVYKNAKQMAKNLGASMNNKKRIQIEKLVMDKELTRFQKVAEGNQNSNIYSTINSPKRNLTPTTQQQPIIFVDVNLDNGDSSRIIIYDGDLPLELAQSFATKHNLDDHMVKKLVKLLDFQIKGVTKQ